MAKVQEHKSAWMHAFRKTFSIDTTLGAAGLAFFALLSVFPLFLLIIAIASLWYDPLWVEGQLVEQLEFVIPGFSNLLGENLEQIIKARGSVTQAASLVLIWSASSMFTIMARALDKIWNEQEVRTGFRYRGMALLFVAIGGLITLPALFILTTGLPIVAHYIHDLISILYVWLTPIISILISSLLFGLMYRFVPHHRPRWREVWYGAVTCGVLWEVAKIGFQYYISNYLSASNLVYGSFATIIALLTWIYISGLIFFFGAHLINGYEKQYENINC